MKRLFDIVFSLLEVILLFSILLVLAILIKKEDDGPIFYREVRVGRHGKPFRFFKFRTTVRMSKIKIPLGNASGSSEWRSSPYCYGQ